MARNQEKANGMFNRWVQMKKDEGAPQKPHERRPFLASEVTTVPECERWRTQIIRQISKMVAAVQNGSLGEHKIRDLNDQINKHMREKRAWEHQIKALGGADYLRSGNSVVDSNGERALGTDGYFYFGAARELPGVRELFERQVATAPKRSRIDLSKLVDADYYGYRDEDDGKLVKLEEAQEKIGREAAVKSWAQSIRAEKRKRLAAMGMTTKKAAKETKRGAAVNEDDEDDDVDDDDDIDDTTLIARAEKGDFGVVAGDSTVDENDGSGASSGTAAAAPTPLRSHVELPSDEDIQKALLAKRKADLIAKYGNAGATSAPLVAAK